VKVLITGFDPFGGEPINPALEAVKLVSDNVDGAEVVKQEIPTVFKKSIAKLEEALITHNPDVVICVGQAGGRFEITPERIAINVDDARIPDNEGNQPIDEPIVHDGPDAYFSKLPVKAIINTLQKGCIPSKISETAGTFVCNHLMYGLLHLIHTKYPHIRGGFIHIPYVTAQVIDKKGQPYISLDELVKGLELAIAACAENT